MSFRRQVTYVVVGLFALFWGIPLLWAIGTLITTGSGPGDDNRGASLGIFLASVWLIGGVIYLAVSAAMRHSRD